MTIGILGLAIVILLVARILGIKHVESLVGLGLIGWLAVSIKQNPTGTAAQIHLWYHNFGVFLNSL
jgi:hypothetical protein